MAQSGKSYAIQTGIYLAICLAVFIGFSIYRRLKFTKRFFAPKRHVTDPGKPTPPRLRHTLGAWVSQVLYTDEETLIKVAGVDAAMYIKILRMGFEMFLMVAFFSMVIILPINVTSDNVDILMAQQANNETSKASYEFTDLDKVTMTNIPDKSNKLYAHFIISWVITLLVFWQLWRYNKEALRLRIYHLLNAPRGAESHTVLLTDIPGVMFGTMADRLDETALRFLPRSVKQRIRESAKAAATRAQAVALAGATKAHIAPGAHGSRQGMHDTQSGQSGQGTPSERKLDTFFSAKESHAPDGSAAEDAALPEDAVHAVHPYPAAAVAPAGHAELTTQQPQHPLQDLETGLRKGNGSAAEQEEPSVKGAVSAGALTPRFSPPPRDGEARALKDYWGDAADRLAAGETLQGLVETEVQKVYGDMVAQVNLVYDTSDLDKLVREYDKLKGLLTDYVDDLVSQKRRGKTLKEKQTTVAGIKYGAWGREKYGVKPVKVPLLEWFRDRLTQLWLEIGEEQEKAHHKFWPSAFVTFHTRTTQVVAADALLCQDLSAWRTMAAPRPEEVYWSNLGWRQWERSMRTVGVWSAFTALVLFFMIPVGAVQALLSLNSVVSFVNSIPVVGTFLTGILPTLALTIFLLILPAILRLLNIMQGMRSESEIDLGVVSRFFIFQVVTVFFGSFIAGSFANQIKQFIDDPGSIVTILGTAAPQTAIFFLSYMQLQALVVQPVGLLRLVPLILFWVFSKLAATERAKARLWQNQEMTYGTLVPGDSIMMLLGLVFSIICPIITPMAALYFAITYIIWKYQMLYVYNQPYQTGGQLWTRVFNQAMTGTFIFQLMMIFILAIKKKIAPSLLCVPLPFLSIYFWHAVHARFWRPQIKLSLMSAAELDAREKQQEEAEPLKKHMDESACQLYLSPSFKLSEEEHQSLLAEAEKGMKLVAGTAESEDLEEPAVAAGETTADEELPDDEHDSDKGPSAVRVEPAGKPAAAAAAPGEAAMETKPPVTVAPVAPAGNPQD